MEQSSEIDQHNQIDQSINICLALYALLAEKIQSVTDRPTDQSTSAFLEL